MLLQAPQTYFATFLFLFMFVLIDTGLHYLNTYINKWYLSQKERVLAEETKRRSQSKSTIKRKVTNYQSK